MHQNPNDRCICIETCSLATARFCLMVVMKLSISLQYSQPITETCACQPPFCVFIARQLYEL